MCVVGHYGFPTRDPIDKETNVTRPRDATHAEEWLYERAEDAAAAGLPLDKALQAVRNGYSSVEADRIAAEDEQPRAGHECRGPRP